MGFVVYVNGVVLVFMAAFMGADALLFPATAVHFLTAAALVGVPGLFLVLASANRAVRLSRHDAFLLTCSVWLASALAGAVPLWLFGLDWVDALFEAMSGITTTGSTVMTGLDTTPRGILFWRALIQGLGGVGFIVTGIALLPLLKVGGMQLYRTESSDKSEKEFSSARTLAVGTLATYGVVLLLCTASYFFGGMSFFDAITHAMATVSTGGYGNYDASFGAFQSPLLEWSATLFMLFGALPFVWYIRAVTKGVVRSEQIRLLVVFLASSILILAVWRTATSDSPFGEALRQSAFNVVSVVTTTGFATTDYTAWGSFAAGAFLVLTAFGGCTGSTSGGAKMMRWIIFARAAKSEITRLYAPHSITGVRYEGRAVEQDTLLAVISFFTFYAATVFALAVALGLVGLDLLTAVSGALTAVANVGPGVGSIIGPAGNFAGLSDPAKLILTFGMYLGRLELLTVFVILMPRYWRAA